jgi:hypothetical protein
VKTSVVVVNWNAGGALAECLASLEADAREGREVILVDNGSTDGSSAAAVGRHGWIRLVDTGANLGFAAGANRGASRATGEVLVFLNPDARVLPGAVALLAGTLARTPRAGIAGGGLARATGGFEPGWARFGPVRHLVLDTTLGRLPARLRRRPHRVDWVYGTFMAVRRSLFAEMGGFDERHFMYGEDLDLCFRAARLGLHTVHVPAARALHGGNLSAVQRFGRGREAEVVKGEMRFYARQGKATLAVFRTLAAGKFGLRAIAAAVLGRWGAAATSARVVDACVRFDPRCA